jgi:crotonobetainyl-CoA:carnitine CoA-transferase CaiB-like acyl-CoA transferase
MAALFARVTSGKGQRVDVSMLDATVFSMLPREGFYFSTGKTPERLGNAHYQLSPWNAYPTSDGRHIVVVAHTEKYWIALLRAMGMEALAINPRFKTNTDRIRHRQALDDQLSAAFARNTLEHWTNTLEAADALFAPVRNFEQVFSDPAVRDTLCKRWRIGRRVTWKSCAIPSNCL